MRLDPAFLLKAWPLVLLISLAVVLVKATGVVVAAKAFKRPWPVAIPAGLMLAQVGEFSFILEKTGREAGLSPMGFGETGTQAFVAVTVLLIALTPLLFKVGSYFSSAEARRLSQSKEVI